MMTMTEQATRTDFAGEIQPDLTATDPYRVLGVMQTADQAEIKRAYFGLIRQYPPETEADKFKLVRAAYEKIKDVQRRSETDLLLPQPPPAWQPSADDIQPDLAFYADDVLLALRRWGDLGRTDFHEDFREIDL
jgi:curved DNA-binding protein CbpA